MKNENHDSDELLISDDLIAEFIAESNENLKLAENGLLNLEQDTDPSTINEIFRAVHSVKGAAGFFQLNKIQKIGHLAETLLDEVRNRKREISRELIDILLHAVDSLLTMVNREDVGEEYDVEELGKQLERAVNNELDLENDSDEKKGGLFFNLSMLFEVIKEHNFEFGLYAIRLGALELGEPVNADVKSDILAKMNDLGRIIRQINDFSEIALKKTDVIIFFESNIDELLLRTDLELPEKSLIKIDLLTKQLIKQADTIPVKEPSEKPVEKKSKKPTEKPKQKMPEPAKKAEPQQQSIRISVNVLDELLELIGEVVLGRNQFINKYENDKYFKSLSQSITKLHQHVIQTRMQPIGVVFNRYKRTVRDLSAQLDKRIDLHIEGEEIELDRTILEAISDPLTHLVRNSVDHGIESSRERAKNNKSVIGNINLRALHESGQITIEVEDDGKGLDYGRIREKAIDKGIITAEEAEKFTDRECANLIFHPGFSTKDAASSISGRGVGMDVVKTNLEKIGCVVEITSKEKKGTLISARIPLTQAIVNSSVISGLIVKIGEHTLAIPQLAVNEVIKLTPEEQLKRIDKVNGEEVFKLRDKIIPLVHLEDILGLERTYIHPFTGKTGLDQRQFIVPDSENPENQPYYHAGFNRRKNNLIFIVLQFKQNYFGILVDKIAGTEEIVVKRLPKLVKHRKVFAGATILGNGIVSFILDINGMVEKSGLAFDKKHEAYYAQLMKSKKQKIEKQKFVIFTYAPNEFFAVPVNLLSEVDRFHQKEIRNLGTREFIQRHGSSIPILRLENHLNVNSINEEKKSYTVIVPSRVQYPTGIMASGIVATIDMSDNINTKEANETGVMGTFFHEDNLITLIDLYSLLQQSDPERYKTDIDEGIEDCKILFVEDQLFFRQLVTQYFKSYKIKHIVTANNGEEALKILYDQRQKFDIIISDIEMPVMDGFELVSTLRSNSEFDNTPIMALTSLDDEENIKKGLDCGFDAYEIKIDKSKVMRKVNELYMKTKKLN